MCTKPRTVAIIAYLDWLNKPSIEKKILDISISIRWYKIIESTESTKNILGPHTKFNEKSSWVANDNDKNIGAMVVVGLGIRNTSLVNILNKSAKIWKAPFLPINVGPIRRWVKASNLRSSKTTKSVSKTTIKEVNNASSCKNLNKNCENYRYNHE